MQDGNPNTVHELITAADQKAAAIQPPACPDWCSMPAGHRYVPYEDHDESAGYSRTHELAISSHVVVSADEWRTVDGQVTVDAPQVFVRDLLSEPLTAAQAYDLGDDLNTAAARVEQINGTRK